LWGKTLLINVNLNKQVVLRENKEQLNWGQNKTETWNNRENKVKAKTEEQE